ncbi:MAG: hypothetical protein J7L38_06675 [Thermoproteales archaeon]|nr:hypothetical protein [Thermoproteales archaeon]
MEGNYTCRILLIDLSTEKVSWSHLNKEVFHMLVGGRGLAIYYLLKNNPGNIDAFHPENNILFATGPLTGVVAGGSSAIIASKSPLTNLYYDDTIVGRLPVSLRKAGINMLVLKGRSETPIYLWINDGEVEFRKANHIWGLNVVKSTETLLRETSRKAGIAVIGRGGEYLVRYASIVTDGYYAVGGGLGAVFGAKKLKGIAVQGLHEIPKPAMFKDYGKRLHPDAGFQCTRVKHTLEAYRLLNERSLLATENFRVINRKQVKYFIEDLSKIQYKEKSCQGCLMRCPSVIEFGDCLMELDWKAVHMLGPNISTFNREKVFSQIYGAFKLGLDPVSAGNVIGWAYEAFEKECFKGLLNPEAEEALRSREVHRLLSDISERRGLGALLAEGVYKASKIVLKGASKYAVHFYGMEVPGIDPRVDDRIALHYTTSGYLRDDCLTALVNQCNQQNPVENVIHVENEVHLRKSLVLCGNISLENSVYSMMLITVTGDQSFTPENLYIVGERIATLIQLFNLREGLHQRTGRIPLRLLEETIISDDKGEINPLDKEKLDLMLKKYYEKRGWSPLGRPFKNTYTKLGINKIMPKLLYLCEEDPE